MTIRQTEDDLRAPTAVVAGYLGKTISLSYLIGLVWTGRWIVMAATLLGLLYGVYIVHLAGPQYMATMHISPAASDSSLGDAAGASGILASLGGSGGSGALQVPKFTQFLYTRGSVEVARELDRRYGLLCRIHNGECDPVTHQWKERAGIKEWFNGLLARLGGLPDPNVGPRPITDLASYVTSAIDQEQNKTNSIVTLTYVNRKPEFAAQFLAEVVKTINDNIRAQNREIQKREVEYLSESAVKTTNVEQRLAIDTLLLQEERQLMMTELDIPYAAKILDGPTVLPVYNAPKLLAISTVVGLLIGLMIALLRDLLPRRWRVW
jgi:hypothetical protein